MMRCRVVIWLLLLVSGSQLRSQVTQPITLVKLAEISNDGIEGFQQNKGENEFSYGCFRSDVSKSLLTRCTNGDMAIEWETATVPKDFPGPKVGFLWIAAMDLTLEKCHFDLYLNGIKRFEIPSGTQENWTIHSPEEGALSFVNVETDTNQDANGYMWMEVPVDWLKKGEGQRIKIVGRAENSNTWIIVYQAADALSWMQHSLHTNVHLEISLKESKDALIAVLHSPKDFQDRPLWYTLGNSTLEWLPINGLSNSDGELIPPKSAWYQPFTLRDSLGPLLHVDSLGIPFSSSFLAGNTIVQSQGKFVDNHYQLFFQRNYAPLAAKSLQELSQSNLTDGRILLMNSSHQDIAWMDSPEKCVLERDTMLIRPLLNWVQNNPDYRFDIEDVLMVKEFIARHPEEKELIKKLLADGRLSCGATFIQPYEEMYSGESLARQFYFGAKWLKDEMDYKANVYWNEDVPGRTLQMMQLMRKAGVDYLMMSRQEKGLYQWSSPDGSSVIAFSPGHYSLAYVPLKRNFFNAAQFIATSSLEWKNYFPYHTTSSVIPLLSDWDMSPGVDHQPLMQEWNNLKGVEMGNGKFSSLKLPSIHYISAPSFFKSVVEAQPNLLSIRGERPAVWLYIHGPSHQQALQASREGDIVLTQAEKFATANALIKKSFAGYPDENLNKAWEAKIYPDHGWGGKNGDITDALFQSKFQFAKTEGEKILDENLKEIATEISTETYKGKALVVFNSLNWTRTDPVETPLIFDVSEAFNIQLVDEALNKVEYQLSDVITFANGSIKKAVLHFIANNVPSIGYKTYYLQAIKKQEEFTQSKFLPVFENQFYRVVFADGGLKSIYDKELEVELIEPGKFYAGELFTMHSLGNGAGEFSDIQQPDMEGFDKTGNYRTNWEVEENGPVYTMVKFRQKIKNAVVELKVRVYNRIKCIDFDVALLNWEGVLYREYRMALPLRISGGKVAYEVPFGIAEVGKDEIAGSAGERYTTPCSAIHPRGIQNWMGASNAHFGVTMSSSVVAADWIDPTSQQVDYVILQPILLASRKSCHWEGNEYLQTGNHRFHFAITSHKPGWDHAFSFGRQANEKLLAVWADDKSFKAHLPESMSFFGVDNDRVLISTIKKAEDSNAIVLRMVDMEGLDKSVQLDSFVPIRQALHTNLIEEDRTEMDTVNGKLPIKLGHHAIETFKLNVENRVN